MRNILAENMLRFGTKNLKDTTQRLKEEYTKLITEGLGDSVDTSLLQVPQDKRQEMEALTRISPAMKNVIKQLTTLNVPLPDGLSGADVMYIMLYGGIYLQKAPRKFLGRILKKKGAAQGKAVVDLLNPDALKFQARGKELPINQHPDGGGVAVIGSPISVQGGMTSTDVDPGPHPAQDFRELLSYMNAYNIAAWMGLDKWDSGTAVNQYDIEEGYNMIGTDDTYVGDAEEGSYKGFVNTADWFEASRPVLILYTSKKLSTTTANTERQAARVEFIPGEKQNVPLPDETFVIGKSVLSDAAKTKIKTEFLTAVKALAAADTKVTSITLTSGASIDEKYKVGTTIADFASASGIPAADIQKAFGGDASKISVVPPAGGASGTRSGNDLLAVYRAQAFKEFIQSIAGGVTVTSNAVVAKGGAGARTQSMTYETLTADGKKEIPAQLINKGQSGGEVDMESALTFQTIESVKDVSSLFDSSKRQTDTSAEN